MTYGRFGPSGYLALGKMAQVMSGPPGGLGSLPRTVTPEPKPPPPSDPEQVESRSDYRPGSAASEMARMLYDRDSASQGIGVQSSGSSLPEMIATEPGMVSLMGLSSGSGYDPLGRAYDTINFDAGSAVGGLAGNLLGGPIAGLAGSVAGRQADWNYALGGSRANGRDVGQGISGMSRGERRAFEEARQALMNRPAPTDLTQNEARMRQQANQMMAAGYSGGNDSNSRGSENSWGGRKNMDAKRDSWGGKRR